jgi:hypothetical protein
MVITFFSVAGGIGYILYGPGITIPDPRTLWRDSPVSAATSTPEATPDFLAQFAGQEFACTTGTLKADFSETNVHLALSDGRSLILPRSVSEGEIAYSNANGSFVFRNRGDMVFVEENGATTYADCTLR